LEMTLTANSPIRAVERKPRMNAQGRTAERVGQHIVRVRKSLGMSRVELAQLSGLDRGSMSRIERGAAKGVPGVRTLLRIFAALYGRGVIVSDAKEPGRRVRILRESYLLTRPEFGSLIGACKENIYTWESGTALPSLAALRRITFVFSVGLDFFSGRTGLPA
jgi:transcriptional regulator with XRE-family HTH domain